MWKLITEVQCDSHYKGIILFKNRAQANDMLKNDIFVENGLEAFIPSICKVRKGVLWGILMDISEDEQAQHISLPVKVTKVTWIMKELIEKTGDGEEKWILTTAGLGLMEFARQTLPAEVSIYHTVAKVQPYVFRPMQYYKCFRFGHISITYWN